jgi:hypothetical protein
VQKSSFPDVSLIPRLALRLLIFLEKTGSEALDFQRKRLLQLVMNPNQAQRQIFLNEKGGFLLI